MNELATIKAAQERLPNCEQFSKNISIELSSSCSGTVCLTSKLKTMQ
jgi:hypothetical protein